MLSCELCPENAESVVIPITGGVSADEVVLVVQVGYT